MSDFSISQLEAENGIKVVGELDVATAPRLTAALEGMASQRDLILDLSEVTFLDSCGLRAIFAAARVRNGDGPVVIRPSAAVARLFELLALEDHAGIDLRDVGSPGH